ncbi:MAG TPA: TonB-dependent receptor, partial [Vicinamibacterales bacterium]
MWRLTRLACVLVFAALVPATAFAQASITGVVRDTSGAVLPGVTVETSSPALIEKVRSVVTDGGGQYRFIDLRPGTYSVTFSLGGFTTVKRDGIELTGTFIASINADMRVGTLEETILVTGETPIVDVQASTQQRVFTQDVIEAIPAGRSHINQLVLIPGLSASQPGRGPLQDVGGTNNLQNTTFVIHGSRQGDTRLQLDGVRVGNVLSEGQFSNFVPDTGSTQEVTVDYAAVSAEQPFGGLRINIVPKEGGNAFRGSVFATGVTGGWQANNMTDELDAAGLPDPNRMKQAYDINPSMGGPIVRDKVWFFGSLRFQDNQNYVAGLYVNKNAGDPTKWVPDQDRTQQGVFRVTQKGGNARVTYQAAQRHKFSFYYDDQGRIWDDSRATISPESTVAYRFPTLNLIQGGWTSTMTNRLLLEARYGHRGEAFGNEYPEEGSIYRDLVPVIEQTTSLQYRGKGGDGGSSGLFGYSRQKINTATASMSYVTGSHSLKVGFTDTWASTASESRTNSSAMLYRFTSAVPTQFTMYAPVESGLGSKVIGEIGLFVQDRWTIDRFTVNAGLRYDQFIGGYPEQTMGPALYQPTRNYSFPATTGNNLKDITPRVQVGYDLFGNGKTALKVSVGKYVLATTPIGNPAAITTTANRAWNDSFYPVGDPRRGNYLADCDLLNMAANAECGAGPLNFGLLSSIPAFNPDTRFGWGNRAWNAEFSTSVQHELMPRVGLDVGYFRRWFGNFTTVDNRANAAADFDPFSVTAPVDSRLPDGGGYVVGGLY